MSNENAVTVFEYMKKYYGWGNYAPADDIAILETIDISEQVNNYTEFCQVSDELGSNLTFGSFIELIKQEFEKYNRLDLKNIYRLCIACASRGQSYCYLQNINNFLSDIKLAEIKNWANIKGFDLNVVGGHGDVIIRW